MHSAKLFLRKVLDHRVCTPIRFLIDYSEFRRSRRVLADSCAKYGWQPLNLDTIVEIRERKKSDVLYILGSGSSVNSISDEAWEEIRANVSIGINHWTLHRFVPDIYAVEPVPDSRRDVAKSRTSLDVDHLNHLRILDRPEVLESGAIVICLCPRSEGENSQLDLIPDGMKGRAFVYYRYTPFTRVHKNIIADYSHRVFNSLHSSSGVVFADSGATLVRMLGLAIHAGFRTVRLLGVDLSTQYFWQEDSSQLVDTKFRWFEQPMVGKAHETTFAINRPFSVIDILLAYEGHSGHTGITVTR